MVTDASGAYTVTMPAGGVRYELHVERIGYFGLTVGVTPAPGQDPVRLDVMLNSRAVEIATIEIRAAPPVSRPTVTSAPGGQEDARLAAFDAGLPLSPGDLSGIAGARRGVVMLGDGTFSIAGQPASQNSVTLDGTSFRATSLPAEVLRSTSVITNTFDPSRGQFSGGQIAATTLNGTNLFGGAARVRLGLPALRTGTPATLEDRDRHRLVYFSGGAGGALVPDRWFWYAAVQGTSLTEPLSTLSSVSPGQLRRIGVDPDSVLRFREIVGRIAPGLETERTMAVSRSETGSALLRLDYVLGSSDVLMLRLDGQDARTGGMGESALALAGSGAELRNSGGGAMVRVTSYRGRARNELRAYASRSALRTAPHQPGPGASVQVASIGEHAEGGISSLHFGGSWLSRSESSTEFLEVSDELVLPAGKNGKMKVGFVLVREDFEGSGTNNLYGSFTFNSLTELEAGRPASFTRTLGATASRATVTRGALFAGHLWRPGSNLSLIYGVRAEARGYGGPESTDEPDLRFGMRPGEVPSELGLSPRVGLTYDASSRAWSVRAGVGEFRGVVPLASLASALAETGMGGGVQQLVCVGPAAPVPDWARYASEPSAAPTTCADRAPGFAESRPEATVFADDFSAPRTWRGSLGWGWSGSVPSVGLFSLSAEGGWALGLSQPVGRDLNRITTPRFTLEEESSRPVYADVSRIDPASGGIAPGGSRLDPDLGRVREISGDGLSSTLQLSLGATVLTRRLMLLNAWYTFTRARDLVGSADVPGASSNALAGPVAGTLVEGASDLERRHLVQVRLSRRIHPLPLEIGVLGRFTSGAPFTPRARGDLDGDGLANDAAFVFSPRAARDPAVAEGMARLLDDASADIRKCIRAQLGQIAARNSCRSSATAELDLQADLRPGSDFRDGRFTVSVIAANVVAGVDRLLHGARGMRGWGQMGRADPTLLFVRGFDADAPAFRYEVNPAFGKSRTARFQPFTLSIQGRLTLGADPVRQPLRSMFNSIRAQGRSPQQIREKLSETIPNLPLQVLALQDTLRLELTPDQVSRLQQAAEAFEQGIVPIADSLAHSISTIETGADAARVRQAREKTDELAREAQSVLDDAVETIRAILTVEQWNRLPLPVRQPSEQLLPAHGGFTISTGEVW